MRISLAQLGSGPDKRANLAAMNCLVEDAADQRTDLIVFPEFAMYDLPVPDRTFLTAAEPLDGPFVRAICEMAGRHSTFIAAGMLEQIDDEDRVFNTIVIASPSGELETVYRKVHLYDAFGARESELVRPSDSLDPVTFKVGAVTVGVTTCYDLRFPEISRAVVDAGAELVILPASWVPGPRKEDHWETLVRARAIENTVFYAAVGQAPPVSFGRSLFVDPMGVVVGDLGEEVSASTFDVNVDRLDRVRARNSCLTDRRYSVIPTR